MAQTGNTWYKDECIMGIDEAGRGPVLGPMVYACAYCSAHLREALDSRGFADSKALTEACREQLFEEIVADGNMGHDVQSLSAEEISNEMLSRSQTSLNVLAADATIRLIQHALQRGVNLTEVFIDTVGDAERYADKLSARFPTLRFTVCPKADAIYPIVSAASIVAKVTRDRQLRDFQPRESIPFGRKFGSGYPGDAPTKQWLQDHFQPVFGFPCLVRFSWSTAQNVLQENAVPVTWACEEAGQQKISFGSSRSSSAATQRHSYFRSRKLQQSEAF